MKSVIIIFILGLVVAAGLAAYAVVDSEPEFLYYAGIAAATGLIPLVLYVIIQLLSNLVTASGTMASAAKEKRNKAKHDADVARARKEAELAELSAARQRQMQQNPPMPPPVPAQFPGTPNTPGFPPPPPMGYTSAANHFAPQPYGSPFIAESYRVGFGPRFGAFCLDALFMGVLAVCISVGCILLIGIMAAALDATDASEDEAAGLLLLSGLAWFAGIAIAGLLYWMSEAIWAGSPGKKILGLQIVNVSGGNAKAGLWKRYAVKNAQNLLTICVVMPLVVLGLIAESEGLLSIAGLAGTISKLSGVALFVGGCMIFSTAKQTLWDKAGDVVVVKK